MRRRRKCCQEAARRRRSIRQKAGFFFICAGWKTRISSNSDFGLGRNMAFFTSAVGILKTLVVAIGAGLAVWGVISLLEGYGNDNPGAMLMCHKVTHKNLIVCFACLFRV